MFVTDHPLRLRIQIEITPQYPPEFRLLYTELLGEYLSEFPHPEAPPVDRTGEDDVSPFWSKIDIFVVLLLEFRIGCLLSCVYDGVGFVCVRFLLLSQTPLALFAPSKIILHPFSREERSHDGVRLFHKLGQMLVCFDRGQLELGYQPVEFIDDKDGLQAVLPCLPQY